jgi:hypothetical protein
MYRVYMYMCKWKPHNKAKKQPTCTTCTNACTSGYFRTTKPKNPLVHLYPLRGDLQVCKCPPMGARTRCDNTNMSDNEQAPELYPIAHSSAYIFLAAMITIRDNDHDLFDDNASEYAAQILRIIQAQPETVLTLPASELEEIGPVLLDNAPTWLK